MQCRWHCGSSALASKLETHPDPIAQADRSASVGISRTLFFGLLASIAVMILGLILVSSGGSDAATHVVALDRVIPDVLRGNGSAVLDSGILMLFATPLVGVVVALAQFVRQREVAFSLITTLLLLVLVAGFAVALH